MYFSYSWVKNKDTGCLDNLFGNMAAVRLSEVKLSQLSSKSKHDTIGTWCSALLGFL